LAVTAAVNTDSAAISKRPGQGRLAVLREPGFRRFFAGYATSLLGSSMASVAVSFAVLDNGGTVTGLGYVFAAGIVPQVLFMLAGGVLADRFGRRRAMLGADAVRCAAQALQAAALFAGRPHIWVFATLAAVRGSGDAFFTPALSGLTLDITSRSTVQNANALLSAVRAAAQVAGPALAGVLVAVAGPAVVIAADAVSYAVSGLALAMLRTPPGRPGVPSARSLLADLRAGWAEFRGRAWLVVSTVQFTLFNLFTWGPFLVLGPVLARDYLGGAGAWGAVMACYGAGSVLGGLLALGRRPGRPMAAATVATFGYALPGALLAMHADLPGVAAGALAAGAGSTLGGVFATTAEQEQLPAAALARVTAFQTVTAFAFGPLAFAAAGPAAAWFGTARVLGFGAIWCVLSAALVLAVPAVRQLRSDPASPVTE
jgi:MFS family permease